MKKAVAIVSGGMDSVTLAYHLRSEGYSLHILAFYYGQSHSKELQFARRCAAALDAQFSLVDLSSVAALFSGSALTDDSIEVPDGHYAEDSMSVTVVPNRNAVMLAIAYAAAVSGHAQIVATGVHAGDHFIYPDCRPEFVRTFSEMQRVAVEGFGEKGLHLYAPFVSIGKHDIVTIGQAVGVPYADTWTCYKGGELHCGTCGTCVERKEAFDLAGVPDPTEYEA